MLREEQIEHWKLLRDEMIQTEWYTKQEQERDKRRITVRAAILELLNDYLNNKLSTEQFRSTFDRKTRTDWDVFGLKGLSGAMFLNILVKHIPDQEGLEHQLKAVLSKPDDANSGRQQMQSFEAYLEGLIEAKLVGRRQLQPTRLTYFVSAFWHMQDGETWPIFYVSGRQALEAEGLYQSVNNPTKDYFTFRDVFMNMAHTLDLKSWDLEHLLVWHKERKVGTLAVTPEPVTAKAEATVGSVKPSPLSDDDEVAEIADDHSDITHTQVQLMLAKIGKKLGCNIWIASNDRSRTHNGERLGDYSLESLPPYIVADPESQHIIELIDVLWLVGTRGVAAAFEVEHTTSIYSGLLRMSDLITLQPNISFPLYIVTSRDRLGKVRKQLSRPTFQTLQLHESCGFFAYEDLIREADNIMRWAKKPEAINELAEYVPTVLAR